jgi:hypothetical protein
VVGDDRECHRFDDVPKRHDVVRHRQGVGVPQVDLLLPGCDLVVAELDGNAERFQHGDGVAPAGVGDGVARHV